MNFAEQVVLTLKELGESTIPEIIEVRGMPTTKIHREKMSRLMYDLERKGTIKRVRVQTRGKLPSVIVYEMAPIKEIAINTVDQRFEKATMRQREHWAVGKRRFDELNDRERDLVVKSGQIMVEWWEWFCKTEREPGKRRETPEEARNPSAPIERYIAEKYGRNDPLNARLTALAFWWGTTKIEWASQWRRGRCQ